MSLVRDERNVKAIFKQVEVKIDGQAALFLFNKMKSGSTTPIVSQTGVTSVSKGIPVTIDGTTYYIPLCTSTT